MKNFLLILSCLCIAIMTQAQERTVTGTVVDGLKDPLIGVSIQQKGTDNGTITDADGRFSLTIRTNADAVLVFSYIGYVSQEIVVGNQQVLNVTLSEDTEQLDEVVVVGYGVQKKSSMTASVASVSVDEIQKQVAPNVASTLQGRIPGVEILQKGGEAGADVKILVRGAGTFGETEPLYVIDGAFSNNGLNTLNPTDIESIEVLKDGAAAAIYGSRAANGVVLITTKQGKKGDVKVDLSATYSVQTPSKKLDFMNANEYREYAAMLVSPATATYLPLPKQTECQSTFDAGTVVLTHSIPSSEYAIIPKCSAIATNRLLP